MVQANTRNPENVLCPCKCLKLSLVDADVHISGHKMTYSGESSNQGGKKSKRAKKASIAAATRERNEGIRISEGGSNSVLDRQENYLQHDVEVELLPSNTEKRNKGRGRAKVNYLNRGKGEKLTVEFNERGQPIYKGSNKLSSFLGTTAREHIPITWKSWKDINESFLDDIWEHVQQKFDVDNCHRKYIMQKLGKHWRDHRSNILKAVNNRGMIDGMTRAAALLKPNNVSSMEEWQAFVKERNSQPYKEKSEIFKKMRASQTIMHTTSRKGFARLEAELRVESEDPDSITRDDVYIRGHTRKNGEPINELARETLQKIKACSETVNSTSKHSLKDDGVARVLGPERRGRVRSLGFGATPSKLNALVYNHNVQSQLQDLRDEIKELKVLFQMKGKSAEQEVNSRDKSLNGLDSLQNKKCKLLSWFGKADVVAKGEITSTNPNDLVHHVPLGNECWRVRVNEVIDNVSLYRPTRELFLLKDALGSTIAWPIRYIEVD